MDDPKTDQPHSKRPPTKKKEQLQHQYTYNVPTDDLENTNGTN